MSKLKQYLAAVITQILVITVYVIYSFYAFKSEKVVLSPIKYTVSVGGALLVIDLVCILVIFRKNFRKNENAEDYHEQEN